MIKLQQAQNSRYQLYIEYIVSLSQDLKMEKARCSIRESNPQPCGLHLLAASDSSGFLSGGSNSPRPSGCLSSNLGWTRPTPCAQFTQTAISRLRLLLRYQCPLYDKIFVTGFERNCQILGRIPCQDYSRNFPENVMALCFLSEHKYSK